MRLTEDDYPAGCGPRFYLSRLICVAGGIWLDLGDRPLLFQRRSGIRLRSFSEVLDWGGRRPVKRLCKSQGWTEVIFLVPGICWRDEGRKV